MEKITEKMSYDDIIYKKMSDFSCESGWACVDCDENVCVKMVSIADFPSEFGQFKILGFVNNQNNEEDHCAIVKGNLGDGENVLVRIHSECLTGDALGSRRCDCGPQLRLALKQIEQEGRGIVVYMRQEGRGIGLTNKLRSYALQDLGIDTYDANIELGFHPEERNYELAIEMLKVIGVKSVRLMTNNPDKIRAVERYGLKVSERIHHELPVHSDDVVYMSTKKERFGHNLDLQKEKK